VNSLKEKDIKVFVGGVHKPFQDCRFSLRSKRLFKIRTVGFLNFFEGGALRDEFGSNRS
jgi:hypothetical protein